MDSNVDRIDSASSKDEQKVLQSSNYGTFSDVAQQEQEVHIAVSAGDQLTTTATDEFENEDMQRGISKNHLCLWI